MNGKELEWQEALTIQDLATAIGGAPGTSFASVETLPAFKGAPRPRLVSRLEWPVTQVPDGVTIKFIVIPSGG